MAEIPEPRAPSKLTIAIVPIIVIGLLIIGIIVLINNAAGTDDMMGIPTTSQDDTSAPDPVKSGNPNGDSQPSDTGTAPGGNNSLLGR